MQDDNKYKTVYMEENDTEDNVDIRKIIEQYGHYWKWFVLGMVLALLLAYVYLRYTPNIYEVSTTILIDDKEGGGLTSELSAFQDLGILGGQKTSLETETSVLKSRTLMQSVARDLELNMTFHTKGKIAVNEVYGDKAPFKVTFLTKDSLFYHADTSFSITAKSLDAFVLKNADGDIRAESNFGESIPSKFGELVITPAAMENMVLGQEVFVYIKPLKSVANSYRAKITIAPESKNSNALSLGLKDPIKSKARAILDNLIAQYNKDAVADKSMIAQNTDAFINQRIADISVELTSVDMGVEDYKTDNMLTDLAMEANIALTSNSEVEKKIVDLTSQLKLIDYVSAYMKANQDDLIPSNLGLKDETTSQTTLNYNMLLLERNRILGGSSSKNPTVVNLEAQIATLRESIDRSLMNLRSSLAFSLNEARLQESRLNSRRALAPKQEREFQDIKRKQQIIETLYLYLLEKREENAISLAVTAPNAKIIDRADGSDIPVSPKRKIVYVLAGLLGFLITFFVLAIRFFLDNTIHTLEDVESVVKAPILGDIPSSGSNKKMVITEQDNSNVAEAFRLLRTNIDFMLPGSKNDPKTIFITSTTGNEGKTFIAINLAAALALLNKKVLLVGADVRKPKIAKYLHMEEARGLTHFLTHTDLKIEDVINRHEGINLDIMQSGAIPPNPSELLTSERFEEIMQYARKNYEYIIVDTAPVNTVTDTLLLSHFADLFIYVIRANYLDKRLLKIPKTMFENKRLPNMAVLINDTNFEKRGYGYGYSYGYGEKEARKSWWKPKFA